MMKIAIIGFGMMGRQIAQVFAQYGHDVAVTDENPDAVTAGLREVETGPYGFEAAATKGRITRKEADEAFRRIRAAQDLDDACKGANLVIEAVFESLPLKQEVFARLESSSPKDALLASNTSTLTLDKIGSKLTRKDRVLGMHFFNPAQVTKLVEIIRTSQTSNQTVRDASKIVEAIGKTPIVAKDEPGFIANRLGLTLYMEASKLVEEGSAKIRDVDLAMKLGYNHPMGPFELADFVGLDTRARNLEALFESTGDGKWISPKTLREMVNQGYFGNPDRRKDSKGGYYEFFKISR